MLQQQKVKELIDHSDFRVVKYALKYFNISYSQDKEIINLALQVYDEVSDLERRQILINLTNLKLDERAFLTILNKLKSKDSNYDLLENIIANAEISLIEKYINELRANLKVAKERIEVRLIMHKETTYDLLEDLRFFTDLNEKNEAYEFNYDYGLDIVSELSKREDISTEYFMKMVNKNFMKKGYHGYFEIYLLNLLGELREKDAIPLLVARLNDENDNDIVSDEVMYALRKIGTDDVVEEIYRNYKINSWEFRLFAAGTLGGIKTQYAEKINMELLQDEKNITIKTNLIENLCGLFSFEAIEPIKEIILSEEFDKDFKDIREDLIVNVIASKWYK